ncbi:hypothetical protein [Rufibacter roseus]|uniref:Lipoprotein n=1 Tax=Rufibacter roseus TaxID=1567108 RepID=A0ABW2DKP1_9BACT|nr:hypothetical protein [Rufibacter roseus]
MLKTRILWLLVLLIGCKQSTDTTTTVQDEPNFTTTSPTTTGEKVSTKRLLHVVQRTHPFSKPEQPDYFRLLLRGDSITAGQVQFTITTREGTVIHNEVFQAADLEAALVNEMEKPAATTREREAFIIKRMEEFVQPADFVTPAIAANMPPDTAFVTLSYWNQLQERENTIGFKYLLGKEDGRLLVFDPEKKKAVRYGSFGG